jgi:hypothetical protein
MGWDVSMAKVLVIAGLVIGGGVIGIASATPERPSPPAEVAAAPVEAPGPFGRINRALESAIR